MDNTEVTVGLAGGLVATYLLGFFRFLHPAADIASRLVSYSHRSSLAPVLIPILHTSQSLEIKAKPQSSVSL